MTDKLQRVGGQVVLEGVDRFKRDAATTRGALDQINQATETTATKTAKSWSSIASAVALGSTAAQIALNFMQQLIDTTAQALVGVGADVQASMLSLSAATETPISKLGELQETILQIGAKSPLGVEKVADAADQLGRAGIEVQDIMSGALAAVNNFYIASSGEVRMEQGILTVAAAINAFNLDGTEAARVVNALTAASIRSAITFTDLDRSFRQAVAVTAMLGFEVEDLATALGVLGGAALRSSDAGTSLRQMFISLMGPSSKATAMMKFYGISLYDAAGEVLPLRDILIRLESVFGTSARAISGMTQSERDFALATIFGSDSVRAAIALLNAGVAGYDDMRESINSLTAEQVATGMLQNNLNAQSKIFISNLQSLAATFSMQFIPAVGGSIQKLNGLLQAMSTEKIKVFGSAIATLFSGKGLEELRKKAASVFGAGGAEVFNAWIDSLMTLRSAVMDDLIPSLVLLGNSIVTNNVVTKAFASVLTLLAKGLSLASGVFRYAAGFLTTVLALVTQNTTAVKLLTAAFIGFAAIQGFQVLYGVLQTVFTAAASAVVALEEVGTAAIVAAAQMRLFTSATISATTASIVFGLQTIGVATINLLAFAAALVAKAAVAVVLFTGTIIASGASLVSWIGRAGSLYTTIAFISKAFFTLTVNAVRAASALVLSAARGAGAWLAQIPKLITSLSLTAAEFVKLTAKIIANTVAMIAHAVGSIPALVKAIPTAIASIIALAGAFYSQASAAISAATATLAAKAAATGIIPVLIGAAVVIATVAAAVYLLKRAWDENWGGMREKVASTWKEIKKFATDLGLVPDLQAYADMMAEIEAQQKELTATTEDQTAALSDLDEATYAVIDATELLTSAFAQQLSQIPQATQSLAEYIAGLDSMGPGMVAEVTAVFKEQQGALDALEASKKDMARIDLELLNLEQRTAQVQNQQAINNLLIKMRTLQYERAITEIENQQYELNKRLLPLKKAIADIDVQIEAAQSTQRSYIAQITALTVSLIPYKKRLAIIENEITDLVDERIKLEREEKELYAEKAQIAAAENLKTVSKTLEEAWAARSVPDILRLERLKEEATAQEAAADDRVEQLRNETRLTEIKDRLIEIGLEKQKNALEDAMEPIERQIEMLQLEQEAQAAITDQIVQGLEQQRAALEAQQTAIDNQITALDLAADEQQHMIDVVKQSFQSTADALELSSAQLGIYQNQLELTRAQQAKANAEIIMGYTDALVASGYFTQEEALETLKRMDLWDEQASKWVDLQNQIVRARQQIGILAVALDELPKKVDVEVKVNTIYNDSYGAQRQAEVKPQSDAAYRMAQAAYYRAHAMNLPKGYAQGGIVPGPYGKAQLAIVHGGERFLGINGGGLPSVRGAESSNIYNQRTSSSTTTYEINPTYEREQDPATLAMDLRALLAITKR